MLVIIILILMSTFDNSKGQRSGSNLTGRQSTDGMKVPFEDKYQSSEGNDDTIIHGPGH